MGVRVLTAGSALGLLALLAACTEGGTSSQPTATSGATTGTSSATSASGAPADGPCPVGEYEVSTITGSSGTEVNGIPITASSGGGLTLALTAAGTWTLTGQGASVTLKAAQASVSGTVNGTAEGTYAKTGAEYTFRQERATGSITLSQPVAGISSLPMDQVGPALAPAGTATLTCGPGTLRIDSAAVRLELERTGAGASPSPSATPGAPGPAGGTLTVNDSGQRSTIECQGRTVAVNGSANQLTFTGVCAAVSVNGSRNQVTLAETGQISVNGSGNTVTWSAGDPKVSDNGTGNTVSKG